jgi:hypothetical protein
MALPSTATKPHIAENSPSMPNPPPLCDS